MDRSAGVLPRPAAGVLPQPAEDVSLEDLGCAVYGSDHRLWVSSRRA
eukprot:CAMPEP_0198695016 /NCGR_PEP_ID=MMETSP1468-20131203/280798_1 /TAXON_ID=1461545 /ORGANISM="Mantoniella sp, Strain CCMP1436" /LENGTH=46 /DNA_ID= /DNA_START= /DNA_END= /DNA_ORIENTATION=